MCFLTVPTSHEDRSDHSSDTSIDHCIQMLAFHYTFYWWAKNMNPATTYENVNGNIIKGSKCAF